MIYPMAAYIFYIWAFTLYNLFFRIGSVKSGETDPRFFKTYSKGEVSEKVLRYGRHLDNQFQLPMIFLITCLTVILLGLEGTVTKSLAWAFVVSRMIHAFVHLGSNKLFWRLRAFALGWLCIIATWVYILVNYQ